MIRRTVITATNILLLCLAVARGIYYYGRVMTSAPQWMISVCMALEYIPAIVAVNVINGVWKRIQQHRSCRVFLVVTLNLLLFLQMLLVVHEFWAPQSNLSKLGCYLIGFFVINFGNLIWMALEKKYPVPETEEQ